MAGGLRRSRKREDSTQLDPLVAATSRLPDDWERRARCHRLSGGVHAEQDRFRTIVQGWLHGGKAVKPDAAMMRSSSSHRKTEGNDPAHGWSVLRASGPPDHNNGARRSFCCSALECGRQHWDDRPRCDPWSGPRDWRICDSRSERCRLARVHDDRYAGSPDHAFGAEHRGGKPRLYGLRRRRPLSKALRRDRGKLGEWLCRALDRRRPWRRERNQRRRHTLRRQSRRAERRGEPIDRCNQQYDAGGDGNHAQAVFPQRIHVGVRGAIAITVSISARAKWRRTDIKAVGSRPARAISASTSLVWPSTCQHYAG